MKPALLLSACGLLRVINAHAAEDNYDTPPAQEIEWDCAEECCQPNWSIQVRGAALIFLPHDLREIYGSGVPTIQLESSYLLCDMCSPCDRLLLWGNLSWSFKTGHSIGPHYHSRLNLVPISIGLEYQTYLRNCIDFYFGIGPSYSFLRIINDDHINRHHINRGQFGFITKAGFRYTFCTNYFLDVFADYQFTRFRKMNDSIQSINSHFSGFYVGAGLGVKW